MNMNSDRTLRTSLTTAVAAVLLCMLGACGAKNVQVEPDPGIALTVTLDGGTEHQVVSIFGSVIAAAHGVRDMRLVSSTLTPDSPQNSRAAWTVTARDVDSFSLQSAIMDTLRTIIDSGGSFELQGKTYHYAAAELSLLKGVRPGTATARSLQFVVDRELMRDLEFFGR